MSEQFTDISDTALSKHVKRIFDIVLSAIALILCAPLLLTIAFMVWLVDGSPVFFTQWRAGLHGRPFKLMKFRTMRPRSGERRADSDAARLTALGRRLRRLSLDELPQLWNVLRGEMSLVGPRPLFVHYLPLYSERQNHRHDVRPGLTGWAQVNGRNSISWDQRFELDLWYIEHHSLRLDVEILWRTVAQAARGDGLAHAACATMPEFTGSLNTQP